MIFLRLDIFANILKFSGQAFTLFFKFDTNFADERPVVGGHPDFICLHKIIINEGHEHLFDAHRCDSFRFGADFLEVFKLKKLFLDLMVNFNFSKEYPPNQSQVRGYLVKPTASGKYLSLG